MSVFRMVGALGVVLAGAVALVVSGAAGSAPTATRDGAPPTARRNGAPAAVNAGADDPMDISANNSPSLARNPTDADNVVIVNRVDLTRFSCRFNVSFDGGVTWEERRIPQPPGTEPKCYAPDVAFGPDGILYVSYVMLAGLGNAPDSVWVASSRDGGRSLSQPSRAAGPLSFQVRLAPDPRVPGRLYLTWLDAEATAIFAFPLPGYPIVMSSSDDGGRTWRDPVRVSDQSRERVVAPTLAVRDDGGLFVLYLDVLDDRLDYHGGHEGFGGPAYPGPWELVLARSVDSGRTWTESTVADDLVPMERFIVFLPAFPSLTVDGDRLNAAFHDARLGDADVWVWTSRNGGATWDAPVRVNDTPPGDGTSQYLPKLAVASGGRLDVVYYDRRADGNDVMNEVSLQSSVDGGETFGPRLALSDGAFDSRVGFGSERQMPDLGSRLALLSTDDRVLSAWADTRNGTVDSGKQDIMRAFAAFREAAPGGARSTLWWLGLVLVAAGLVVLGASVVRSPRRPRPGRPGGRRSAGGRRR